MARGRTKPRKRRSPFAPMRPGQSFAVHVRFFVHLAVMFRWPLLIFWGLVFIGGALLKLAAAHHPDMAGGPLGYMEACYDVFLVIFLETPLAFPETWYIQPFYFLLPIVGLGALADSFVRLGYLLFSAKARNPEWNRMVASTYRKHVVVLGVGRVGVSVIKGLLGLREPVVAIEQSRESLHLDELRALNVPVIHGNGRLRTTLEAAQVARARSLVTVTDDDMANLDAALTAREMNPDIDVVLRMFDDTLAAKVAGAFTLPAISPAQVSAPSFIAAATGRKVFQSFQLDGRELNLIDVEVCPESKLAGTSVGEVQKDYDVNIVMHRGATSVDVNPGHEVVLEKGDTILVIAPIECLARLEETNRPCSSHSLVDDLIQGTPLEQ